MGWGHVLFSPTPPWVCYKYHYIYIYFKSRHSKFSLDFSFPISCQQRSYEWLMAWGRLDYWCYHLRLSHCWTVWRRLWITFFFFLFLLLVSNWLNLFHKYISSSSSSFPFEISEFVWTWIISSQLYLIEISGNISRVLEELVWFRHSYLFLFLVWFCSTLKLVCIC